MSFQKKYVLFAIDHLSGEKNGNLFGKRLFTAQKNVGELIPEEEMLLTMNYLIEGYKSD